MSLSTRFALCLAVLVPLMVSLAGWLVLSLVSADLRAERDRQLIVRLRALTPMAASYAWRARAIPVIPPNFLEQRLTAAGGEGGFHIDTSGAAPLVIGDVPATLPPPGDGPADFTEGGRRWRFVAAHLGRRDSGARLWLFDPEERLAGQISLLTERLVTVTLAAAGLGAVAGFTLGRFAVRPLATLSGQAQAIDTPARTEARLATSSGVTEIDRLAALLNDLLDRRDAAVARTGEALESARAFAATAAHELRTPLTSMGANVSLLGHPDLDPAERDEIIADLGAEHGRIQRLITMLRRLARGELVDPATFAETDLSEIVGAAADDARRRHPEAVITASTAGALTVRGWAEGLRMIADNLLDNAAIHGRDEHGQAVIAMDLSADGEDVVLTVRDRGPGIPEDDRESVFTRFQRCPGSPGSGLGLTLVRQQAALHGGTATVTGEGGGTCVEVRLPASGHPPERPAGGRSWLEQPRRP
ncbi:sensor histidine kinase [Nonomuraea cavernae]|uniref:histidine kinase n=1 Tax=Nonomuraea cavernae TaxID=2045107 RepID=A0A917Z8F3_9ACTN|nr:HAMP domain-containing sensor histidine kinase [Nonomuraea cavernae]MCA2189911.1 HAMP domain-containing histidine kinase [Nonomuraea cavernae]GGO77862.1 two-component sensor histidine kinase [Nonomuraea cavernae]